MSNIANNINSYCSMTKTIKTLIKRGTYILLALGFALNVMGQTQWTQQNACPGWNNPTNFTAWTNGSYGSGGHSGSGGVKNNNECPNPLTGATGAQSLGPSYTAAQMNSISSSCTHASIPLPARQFAVMTDTTGTDPNTDGHLKYVPSKFNRTDTANPSYSTHISTSIRVGDVCAAGGNKGVSVLNYDMKVTSQNALVYLYYAIVAQSPTHGQSGNPTFIIRAMKKNASGEYVQISDTMASYMSTTPDNPGSSGVCANIQSCHIEDGYAEDGKWHSAGSSYNTVVYKDWERLTINLSNYLYDTVRIQVVIYDCMAAFHYAYAYIAGECRPMALTPASAADNHTALTAPRGMARYEWAVSEYGVSNPTTNLINGQANDYFTFRTLTVDNNGHPAVGPEDTVVTVYGHTDTAHCYQYSPKFSDWHVLYRPNANKVPHIPASADSSGDWQTFRCRMTSYIDSTKPFATDLYINQQKPEEPPLAGSDHCVENNCGEYQWPPVPSSCPEVTIKQKYDHVVSERYQQQGWDTAVTCYARSIELSSTPYIPVQYFNGYYCVQTIPYNPPDTSFYLDGQGLMMSIYSDDRFTHDSVVLDFPFYFFGKKKNYFRVGDNGMVTFTENYSQDHGYMLDYCPYIYNNPIPWDTAATPDGSNFFNRMHDAIYGIYEDTYVGSGGSLLSGNQGIYYGVVGEYPCRKIIASWNEIPLYGNPTKRESYQIVCYEGSNIIEVHVKKREAGGSSTNNGRGLIGIQNATGQVQERGATGTSTMHVQNGAPAAFWPDGRNIFNAAINETSYRFTPLGINPSVVSGWYRIFDDGRADVELTQDVTDTNGYYIPMDASDTNCPTLTRAIVQPTVTSRYVYRLRFQNANGDWYDLADTITIGIDTLNMLTIKDGGANDVSEESICFGEVKNYMLTMNALQDTQQVTWVVTRSINGSSTPVPLSMLHLDTMRVNGANRQIPFSINTSEIYGGTAPTSTDTITVTCMANFTNGCSNYCQLSVAVSPSAIEDTVASVCDSLVWHGTTYRSSTVATYTPPIGCNVIRLTLNVRHSSDTVIVHDVAENYLPYIIDTLMLTHDTTFTMHTINSVDCDSTITVTVRVHLNQDTTVDRTVCEGQLPLLWNDVPFYLAEVDYSTNTITHQTTIPTVHGADSLITMHLHLLYNSTDTISDTIYQNDLPSFTPPLPVSVSYTQDENDPALVTIIDSTIVIPNAVSCDSLVYYTLYLYRNFHTYDTVTVCDNQLPAAYLDTMLSLEPTVTLPLSNTVTRDHTFAHKSIHNTDSIATVTLIVHPTYEVSDTVVICSYNPFIYEGVDYGGPADFDTILNSIHHCDSLVHVSLQARDTLFHLAPLISLDSAVWYSVDTTLIGCDPQNLWLIDTSASVSREWAVWSVASADTTGDTLNIYDTILPIGIYSYRIIAVGAEGCIDTVQRDSAIHIFQRPTSDFIYEPAIVPFHDPKISLLPQATPADSLTYRWLIALDGQGNQHDTLQHDEQQSDGLWHYSWEPLTDSGHYDVALVAYWKHTVIKIINTDTLTLSGYCTDTAHHPVTIVNTYLQFPSLVTPNGDGTNDTWEIVNLVEMGQYQTNEVWIYNQWGALVFHAKNIDSHEQCWDPNATNSPDGTYFFRFSGKGRFGVAKRNGTIEVMR